VRSQTVLVAARPEADRELARCWEVRVAVHRGDFVSAARNLDERRRVVAGRRDITSHYDVVEHAIRDAYETGHAEAGAQAARAYFEARDRSWPSPATTMGRSPGGLRLAATRPPTGWRDDEGRAPGRPRPLDRTVRGETGPGLPALPMGRGPTPRRSTTPTTRARRSRRCLASEVCEEVRVDDRAELIGRVYLWPTASTTRSRGSSRALTRAFPMGNRPSGRACCSARHAEKKADNAGACGRTRSCSTGGATPSRREVTADEARKRSKDLGCAR